MTVLARLLIVEEDFAGTEVEYRLSGNGQTFPMTKQNPDDYYESPTQFRMCPAAKPVDPVGKNDVFNLLDDDAWVFVSEWISSEPTAQAAGRFAAALKQLRVCGTPWTQGGKTVVVAPKVVRRTGLDEVAAFSLMVGGAKANVEILYARRGGLLLLLGIQGDDEHWTQATRDLVFKVALDKFTGTLPRPSTVAPTTSKSTGHTGAITSAAWSPDGKRLATSGMDKTVRIWDGLTGATLRKLTPDPAGLVLSLAWSPDGTRLATTGMNRILVWDVSTGAAIRELAPKLPSFIESIAWSPDGRQLVTGGTRGTDVWELSTGVGRTLGSAPCGTAAWSPDGRRVTGCAERNILIWDAATGSTIRTLVGHPGWVTAVAWSPDSTRIVSGSEDKTARIWDAATGATTRTLTGHTSGVNSVAWSPDGTRIATGSADATVRIWDAATGVTTRTLTGHTSAIRSVAWSPDGKRIASGGADMTVRIWDAATGATTRIL